MLTKEEIEQVLQNFQKLEFADPVERRKAMMMGSQIQKDQMVWFKNPRSDETDQDNSNKPFYVCNIVKINGDKVTVKLIPQELKTCKIQEFCTPNGFEVPLDLTMEYSKVAEKGLADMVEIDELNHASLLHNLQQRYFKDEIYTYVGPILLAMNPFKDIPHLYYESEVSKYMQIIQSKNPYDDRKALPPHVFAITSMAYKQMIDSKIKQAIVISGESGAGKTESAKRAMKFLTSLGSQSSGAQEEVGIEQKILDTNPVLESFGNSKTMRNNNSSRFGKYVLLYFSASKGEILGARIKNYLLEKSRVVGPAAGERNYHVFYHILRGASEELLRELGLLDPLSGRRLDIQDFNYLRGGSDVDQTKVNDVKLFKELAHQFNSLQFTAEEQSAIWRITASCLHLGEIYFDDSTYDENGKPCTIINQERMQLISKLLGFEKMHDLVIEIVNKASMPGQTVRAPLKKNECSDSRDSLAKSLFDNLFNWLVERMNLTILPENEGDENFARDSRTIGLLDIFGFENFPENNFEQLCINYVNEKLHKIYISAIFDAEKFELRNEGLADKVNSLKYPDLTSLDVIKCLDEKLVTGAAAKGKDQKIGIFNIVNDCSTQKPRPTWEALMKRIEDTHKSTKVYFKEKVKEKFKIKHSAKEVIYNTKTFIERNVDEISATLENAINTKGDKMVSKIFQGIVKPSQLIQKETDKKKPVPGGGAKKTIWAKFSFQMQDLMNELAEPLLDLNKDESSKTDSSKKLPTIECENCQLHFIRCIKPNEIKVADVFINAMCLQQITYMGVLESIDLKQKNYPFRKNFEEFYQKYELLSPLYGTTRYDQMIKAQYDFRQLSQQILKDTLQGMCQEYYAVGKTKILMMTELVTLLDKAKSKAREQRDQQAAVIKRAFSLFLGNANTSQKKVKMQQIQKFLKKKRQEIREKKAKRFFEYLIKYLAKVRIEKRRSFETKAALVLTDVYKKHMFRKQLAKSITDRKKVIKSLSNFSTIIRLRKLYITYSIMRDICAKSFAIGRQRADDKSTRTVQRIFRGFSQRQKSWETVVAAVRAKENLKKHIAAKKVQKVLKGLIVRKRMMELHLTAQKIQGWVKMKWHREFFLKLKKDVNTIQRSVRRFLARRKIIKVRLTQYLSHELQVISNVRIIENHQLLQAINSQDGPSEIGFNTMMSQQLQTMSQGSLKPHTPYQLKKIQLFTRVLDLHILTDLSEIYSQQGGWAAQLNKLHRESLSTDQPIMGITTGQTHTMAVNQRGKLYAWGWNENGQCAKNPDDATEMSIFGGYKHLNGHKACQVYLNNSGLEEDGQIIPRIKQVVSMNDRNLILTQDSQELWVWGSNEKGQLGLGTYNDEWAPRKLDFFSKQGLKVSMVSAGGDLTMAACENGEAYAWPFHRGGTTYSLPVKMPFSEKIKITRVSCGMNFGFFITNQGLVYSLGKDNSEGQLGLGHIYPRDVPEMITCLKDIGERIDQLECGYKHVVARSTLGKLYTWGWGAKGQLGHGHFDSEISPRLLNLEKNKHKEKVIQISAGFSHTVIMTETLRELQWFGTCGHINLVSRPVSIRLHEHMPDLFPDHTSSLLTYNTGSQSDFAVVKLGTNCWGGRNMSQTTVCIADLRAIQGQYSWQKIHSTLQQLTTKWDPREVMPPYIDTIAGMFSAHIMRIPGTTSNSKANEGTNMGATQATNTTNNRTIKNSTLKNSTGTSSYLKKFRK